MSRRQISTSIGSIAKDGVCEIMTGKLIKKKNRYCFVIGTGKIIAGAMTLVLVLSLFSCSGNISKIGEEIQLTGSDFSAWHQVPSDWKKSLGKWKVAGDALINSENQTLLTTKPGTDVMINGDQGTSEHLVSKKHFGDIEAHIEFMIPKKSNSGVYFMGRYEIQIQDSWGNKKLDCHDCSGIYQRWDENREPKGYEGHPPRVNASLPAGQWQSLDAVFIAPRFDRNGKKIANARFEKVVHNGIVVHENVELTGPTRASLYDDEKPTGPLFLQGDHGSVAYRNIRVVRLNGRQL